MRVDARRPFRSLRARLAALCCLGVLAACATSTHDVYMRGGGVDAPFWGGGPDSGTIDFEHRVFAATMRGEHYTGVLAQDLDRPGTFWFIATAPSGAELDCFVSRVYDGLWRGECTDAARQRIELQVGTPMHV